MVGDILLLTPHNLSSEGIQLDNVRYLSLDEHQKLEATQLNKGDVIVSLLQRSTLAAVYNLEPPANINNYLVKLQLKSEIDSDYLVDYLNSEIGQSLFNSIKSGTTIPIITLTHLMEIPIILPPLEKQKEIIKPS
ncbi:restriction endonuclease subunit S [Gloeothece verrucosa]|uniref:restriction endonuclease subunit S n=1 Tax=Gloeothece verrucosa TaxID=2546359 RepID=UPI00017E1777|nr:restriction endonuclease subunit S [Gloeothece verrucosa]